MRGDEARKLCAELQIVQVPTAHGKADLTAYRAAGKEVQSQIWSCTESVLTDTRLCNAAI